MNNKEKLINAIEKKTQKLYRSYNSKVFETWSETQKQEWYNIYGMIEALEIITDEKYGIDGTGLIKLLTIKKRKRGKRK